MWTEIHLDDSPQRSATVAHYPAGVGTGLLLVWLTPLVETVLKSSVAIAVALFALTTGCFLLVPLPRSGLSRERRQHTARDWTIAAAACLLVLVSAVVALTA